MSGVNPDGSKKIISAPNIQKGLEAASAAGVPFAGAGAGLIAMLIPLWATIRKKDNYKAKTNAHYQAFQDIKKGLDSLKTDAKEFDSPDDAIKMVDTVKAILKTSLKEAQAANNIRHSVIKDLAKMKKKGELK